MVAVGLPNISAWSGKGSPFPVWEFFYTCMFTCVRINDDDDDGEFGV